MKTLMQKDLRENFKLALIGLGIFALLLTGGYSSCHEEVNGVLRGNMGQSDGALSPLFSPAVTLPVMYFCAIFGMALGWLQVRNEAHRDLWAFLIHRPITRTRIFAGKVAAGLILYGIGAGLPLATLVVMVATPGHVAVPFEWPMVLPLLMIFLSGIAYYFAGLLTGLRQARWYGSRCLGVGAAVLASGSVFIFPKFWEPLLVVGVAILVLALAVWGAYQSGGFYGNQSRTGKAALVMAIVAGNFVVLFAAAGIFTSVALNPFFKPTYSYQYYRTTRDGTIYRVTYRSDATATVADLDGHPVMDPKTGRPMEIKELNKRVAYNYSAFARFDRRDPYANDSYFDGSHFFHIWNVADKVLWYIDHNGRVVGYDGRTRRFVGELSADKTSGDGGPFLSSAGGYFDNSYQDGPRSLLTAHAVYQADAGDRRLKPIFTTTNGDEIGGYHEIGFTSENEVTKNLLVLTRHSVVLLDTDGAVLAQVPALDFTQYVGEVGYLKPTNHFVFWLQPDYRVNQKSGWKMPEHVIWLAPGQAPRTLDLPILRPESVVSVPDKLMGSLVPPVLQRLMTRRMDWDYPAQTSELVLGIFLTLIAAGIGVWQMRRYRFSTGTTAAWTVFILVLGIPGLLTLLAVQEWPMREPCPQCRKLRVVDRDRCEHCDAEFPPAEKNGTEIFEPMAGVAS